MPPTTKEPITFKEPTNEEKQNIYAIYELIFSSHFSLPKKRSVMTAALGYEVWSWRVTGITEEAIKAIARNNFNKPARMLARDHRLARVSTYNRIFEKKVLFEEWWDWVWKNDETTLMTNEEHHTQSISKIYKLDPTQSYFVNGEVAGWHQTKAKEGALVKTLIEEHSIAY
jgi:hypothetical protein